MAFIYMLDSPQLVQGNVCFSKDLSARAQSRREMVLVISLSCLGAYSLPGEHKNWDQLQVGCYVLTYSLIHLPLSGCFLDAQYWVLPVGWWQLFSTAAAFPLTKFLLSAATRFLLDTLAGFIPSASCSESRSFFPALLGYRADERTPKNPAHMVVQTCVCVLCVSVLELICFVSH